MRANQEQWEMDHLEGEHWHAPCVGGQARPGWLHAWQPLALTTKAQRCTRCQLTRYPEAFKDWGALYVKRSGQQTVGAEPRCVRVKP